MFSKLKLTMYNLEPFTENMLMVILLKTTEEVNRRVVGQISKMDFYIWAVLGSGGSRMGFVFNVEKIGFLP